MKRTIAKILVFVLPLLFLSSHAVAEVSISAVFTKGEVSIIADWYLGHGGPAAHGNGNGRKKSKGLPPGIAKNLARGKPLPPGIAKQYLPQGLLDLLPRPPHGFERIIVDGILILVEIKTRVIHDILEDIVLH